MGKQMLDIAYDVIKSHKRAVPFIKIWEKVCIEKNFTEQQKEDKVADFFSDMTLDDRFINVEGNKWDIKSRRKFDEVVIDADAISINEDGE